MALFRSGLLALVLLGSGYHAASAVAHERFAEASARIDAECRAHRRVAAHHGSRACTLDDYAPSGTVRFEAALHQIKEARTLLAIGEVERARAVVAEVLDTAVALESRETQLAAMMAAQLVDGLLDLAEANPRDLDARAIAARAPLWSADHPLDTTRMQRLWLHAKAAEDDELTTATEGLFTAASRSAPSKLYHAHRMAALDRGYFEVQRALLAGDEARCASAMPDDSAPISCRFGAKLVAHAQRVRAVLASPRPAVSTPER